jgi:DNA replicative helicase MCM subunit Mcm2 (Cdc46/Mcm family)
MEQTILNIIKHNSPQEATAKIIELLTKAKAKELVTKEDVEEAFNAGQSCVEGVIRFERWGNDTYADVEKTKTFKQWFHEHSNQKKIKQRKTNIAKILLNELEN